MAPLFLGGGGSANSAKHFQIRLDETNLVLRGDRDESPSALLKGSLVLCLSEPLKVQGISLCFTGQATIDFPCLPVLRNGQTRKLQETGILEKTWDFVKPDKGHTYTLAAGNYEYPFQYIVPGNVPESIETLRSGWVIYRLKATIERGRFAKDVYARKHVRVVRTFDPSSLEIVHNMSVESVWPNKLAYNISTGSKAIIFGTQVQLDFKLIPLLKGLKIGPIDCALYERQTFEVDQVAQSDKYHYLTRIVAEATWPMDEDPETEDIDGQDGWVFSRSLPLPKNLKDCVQSVETHGIKVKHQVKFVVALLNPDGHKSELKAALPIQIFISPNLPLNDDHQVMTQTPLQSSTAASLTNAPPTYGDHSFDQLYSSIDPSGFTTPGATSGFTTPFTQSRRNSHESLPILASADLPAQSLSTRLHTLQNHTLQNHTLQNHTLQNHTLQNHTPPPQLHPRRHRTTPSHSTDATPDPHPTCSSIPNISYFPPPPHDDSRESTSNPLSRRTSDERADSSGPVTPQHLEYDNEEMCKVPSYNTALQGPLPTPFIEGLPNYRTAVSRPPSPVVPGGRGVEEVQR